MTKIEIEMTKREIETLKYPIIIETSGIVVYQHKGKEWDLDKDKLILNYQLGEFLEHMESEIDWLIHYIDKDKLLKDRKEFLKVYTNSKDLLNDYDCEKE